MPIRRNSEDIVHNVIKELYLQKPYKEIAKILGVSERKVRHGVKKLGLPPKHRITKWTEEEMELVRTYYPNWDKLEGLLKNRSVQSVSYKAMELGVTTKAERAPKVPIWINWPFFEETATTTDKLSYFIGLFHADGYISTSRGCRSGFTFAWKDLDLYTRINAHVGGRIYRRNTKHKDYSYFFYGKRFLSRIQEFGFQERKSKTMKFSDISVPLKIPAYIRGLFDGDGCVYISPRNRKQVTITSGCPENLEEIQDLLNRENIVSRIHKLGDRNVWNLYVSQTNNLQFANFIYRDAIWKMDRKFLKLS